MNIIDRILSEEQYNAHIEKMGGFGPYTLSYKDYVNCVKKATIATFSRGDVSKNPTSLMIVAPAGSGKTGLSAYTENKFVSENKERVIRIDPDMIGIYHKFFNEINSEIPEEAYGELQKFIRTVLNDTIRPGACERHLNILVEGTFADTKGYKKIIENQIENGYDVEIFTIVVHRLEELLSCFERQQDRIEAGLPPRINSVEYCDKTYTKFMETLKLIEDEHLYTNIHVYRRGQEEMRPILVYSTGDYRYRTATEAVEDERNIGLREIMANRMKYAQRISNLKNRVLQNPENTVRESQLEQIEILEKQFAETEKKYEEQNR